MNAYVFAQLFAPGVHAQRVHRLAQQAFDAAGVEADIHVDEFNFRHFAVFAK